MGIMVEREISYFDSRFIGNDNGTYKREIKKNILSRWKTCVEKGTHVPIVFNKDDIKDFWHGRAIEVIHIKDIDNLWKFQKYDLI